MEFKYDKAEQVKKENYTGIPNNMKKQFEEYTALSFDDVRVHYNSKEPEKINALAYAQGTQVYIAPGQNKYLPHELGHVVQQKQGRVKPTGKINGLPVNEDISLEMEAENFFKAGYKYNNVSAGEGRIAVNPIQMVKGEDEGREEKENDSVFDFEKLKIFLKKLIEANKTTNKHWNVEASDEQMDSYTERVRELLEDIRQVDLQFLGAAAISFEEEGLVSDSGLNAVNLEDEERKELEKYFNEQNGKKLSKKDLQKKLEQQQKYKNIIVQKLEYMKEIRGQLESNYNELSRQYNIEIANHGRARKPKIVKTLEKRVKKLKQRLDSVKLYLTDVNKQINNLELVLKNGKDRGFLFNLNSLLIKTNDKISMYMAIVTPSKTDRFKDISVDKTGKLTAYSRQMQFGIGTPVRAFSWYLKYLMDASAAANNTPIIRSVDIPEELWEQWQQNSVSEACKKEDNKPMNEDHKVPNQFGVPVASSVFQEVLNNNPALTTIGEVSSMPESLKEGDGTFEDLEQFKRKIGFERLKEGEITPTDVHFFDFEHTAFHAIKDDGSINLYSPENAKERYVKYSNLMDLLILKTGKEKIVKKFREKGIINVSDQAKDIMKEITELLEANHCLPERRSYDLNGNLYETLNKEKEFAAKHVENTTYGDDGEILLHTTKERYKIWYNKYKAEYDAIKERYDEKINSLSKANKMTKEEKQEKIKIFEGQKNKGILNLKEKIIPITQNSGILFELQELGKIDENNKSSFIKLPGNDKIEVFFINILKDVFEKSQAGKLHVIAFCFKLLRLIKDDSQQKKNENEDTLEKSLFAGRKSGDYFEVLNNHQRKSITIGGEEVFIPFDKMTSTGRFKPDEGKPKYEFIPFVGGASGTTRDISGDLMSNNLLGDERQYWKFQMLNASFMILYSYHSFAEVIYRAAKIRAEKHPDKSAISKKIIQYFENIQTEGINGIDIINEINEIIEKAKRSETEEHE